MKRVIICEDSGSGFMFFKKLCSIFNVDCTIVSTYGNLSYRDIAVSELYKLNKGDYALLAFDNVSPTVEFSAFDVIGMVWDIANEFGLRIWYTNYYCFEEVFLSYERYLDFCIFNEEYSKLMSQWVSSLEYVRMCIMTGVDYFRSDDSRILFVKSKVKSASINREKFCKALLRNISRLLRGGEFTITDGSLGNCWLCSCYNDFWELVSDKCSYCSYSLKSSSFDKVMDLERNSISSLYDGFSEFFM